MTFYRSIFVLGQQFLVPLPSAVDPLTVQPTPGRDRATVLPDHRIDLLLNPGDLRLVGNRVGQRMSILVDAGLL
ncbi:hypothetical protein AB0J74_28240 [Asanoa sp. NPDC049573]|uniref:hypothetical protein n=1 Tax=Asanoa sp. NPDC049573 TaxID=3155396 RepID=UPI003416751D